MSDSSGRRSFTIGRCRSIPTLLKRELYKIPIERVEDPALQQLFQEKQEELEMKLTMLRDRDTPRFLYESLQLFGGVQRRPAAIGEGAVA